MTGIIWLIQIVHYPTFKKIGEKEFKAFHSFHTKNITYIVMPIMLAELSTSFVLAYRLTAFPILLQIVLGLVLLIWLSTFMLQIPAHNSLSHGFNIIHYNKLINTNWLRTLAWSVKSIILAYIVFRLMID